MNTDHGRRHGTRASSGAVDGARLIKSFTVSFMLAVAFACAGGASSGSSGKKKKRPVPPDVARSIPAATDRVAARRHRHESNVVTALGVQVGSGTSTASPSLALGERR